MNPGEARTIGVALAVPDPFGSALQHIRERYGDPLVRSIPTHVTLLPPTTVDADLLPEIEEHLSAVASANEPFQVRLRGTATFRPVSPVVFLVLSEGVAGCERLENAVRSGVLWRPLHFNYHPHVTVAHDLPEPVLDAVLAELAGYEADFVASEFRLYEHIDGDWRARRDFSFDGPSHLLG